MGFVIRSDRPLDHRFVSAGGTKVFNAERARNTDAGWSGPGGGGTDRVVDQICFKANLADATYPPSDQLAAQRLWCHLHPRVSQ